MKQMLSHVRTPAFTGILLTAWMWMSLLIDQMPCFMGVPNCD